MTFDFNTVPVGVSVQRVSIAITLRHTYPDDLRMVLQSPAGTAVVLMANAGGDVDLAPGTVLTFTDGAGLAPDAGPITTFEYSPGSVYGGGSDIPAPAPALPHATAFTAFVGQPIRGTWNLWVFDDAGERRWTDHVGHAEDR